MIWKAIAPLAVVTVLAGCGDGTNPFDGNVPGDTIEADIPESISGDVTGLNYDAARQTLVVEGVGLDDVPFEAEYTRRADLDAQFNGYEVYMRQMDPLSRHSTAILREAPNEQVRGGIVHTGGPRNRYFFGAFFERDGGFDRPRINDTSGIVRYAGNYAGLTNIGVRDGILLPVDPSVPVELRPNRMQQTQGSVFIAADFADNRVEGNVYDRSLVNGGQSLPSLVLVATDIDGDGVFSGDVEYDSRQSDGFWAGMDPTVGADIGDYAGIFGGRDSEGVAGALYINGYDGPDDRLGLQGEEERGLFVLGACGTAGANAAICDEID